jgi:hypothetical protein
VNEIRERMCIVVGWVALGLSGCAGGADEDDPFSYGTNPNANPSSVDSADDGGSGGDFDDDGDTGGLDDGAPGDSGSPGDGGNPNGGGGGAPPPPTLCHMAAPAGAPAPPSPKAYSGGSCPEISAGYNTGFSSGGRNREFNLVIPSDYDPARQYPLAFAWYHITGDAMSFVDYIDTQSLADQKQMIFVVPQDSGMFEAVWPMTPLDSNQAEVDLVLFDDLLSCLTEQFSVNQSCVSSSGVSSGGLWTALLGQRRGQFLSANLAFSGGYPTEFGDVWWNWQKSPHRFASLVLWGGPSDQLGVNFHNASLNYISHLQDDGHFVLRCEHTQGHGAPPVGDDQSQSEAVASIFDFVLAHPYWYEGSSPWQTDGLPPQVPDYCQMP